MSKTGQQVEDDLYQMLKESELAKSITGGVYKFGLRPRESTLEDAIVRFVYGEDRQIQSGTVVVNIFVSDIQPYENGKKVRDINRCTALEILAHQWVKSLDASKSDYRFKLGQTIYSEREIELHQHFVSVRLRFELLTN